LGRNTITGLIPTISINNTVTFTTALLIPPLAFATIVDVMVVTSVFQHSFSDTSCEFLRPDGRNTACDFLYSSHCAVLRVVGYTHITTTITVNVTITTTTTNTTSPTGTASSSGCWSVQAGCW
jgi:hypothetical protein